MNVGIARRRALRPVRIALSGLAVALAARADTFTNRHGRFSDVLEDPQVSAQALQAVRVLKARGYELGRTSTMPGAYWRWRVKDPRRFELYANPTGLIRVIPSADMGGRFAEVTLDISHLVGPSGLQQDKPFRGEDPEFQWYNLDRTPPLGPPAVVDTGGQSGALVGTLFRGKPFAVLVCGPITLRIYGVPFASRDEAGKARELADFRAFVTAYLTRLHGEFQAAAACGCPAEVKSAFQLLDGNPAFNGQFDVTDGDDLLASGDREAWISRAKGVVVEAKTAVRGVAADGVSLLWARCRVKGPGKGRFELAGSAADGTLHAVDGAPDFPGGGGRVEVRTYRAFDMTDGESHWLLCVYRPPASFPGDGAERRVRLSLVSVPDDGAEEKFETEIRLVRPPVVLVHGTFDNPTYCWSTQDVKECRETMGQRLRREGFRVFAVDWRETNGQRDPSSFYRNRRAVWENPNGIRAALAALRKEGVAVAQADLVAHSQGAVIARMYARGSWSQPKLADDDVHYTRPRACIPACEYHRRDNFARGDIHRLITISATHHGSDICRLFEAYRRLQEAAASGGPRVFTTGTVDQFSAALMLCMHPQREVKLDLNEAGAIERTILGLLLFGRTSGLPSFNLGTASMVLDGLLTYNANFAGFQFTEGFQGQIPRSEGLRGIGPTRVPSHAIACTADAADMLALYDGYYEQRLELLWCLSTPESLEKGFRLLNQPEDGEELARRKREEIDTFVNRCVDLAKAPFGVAGNADPERARADLERALADLADAVRRNAARLRAATFGNTPNDCTVREASSLGGLRPPYATTTPHVLHGPAPQYPAVQDRVVELLKDGGSLFCAAGFPDAGVLPPNAGYRPGPDVEPPARAKPGIEAPTTGERGRAVTGLGKRAGDDPASKPATGPGAGDDGPIVISSQGDRFTFARRGRQIVLGAVATETPGVFGHLAPGAVLRTVGDPETGLMRDAEGMDLKELGRILGAGGDGTMVTLEFEQGGETIVIQHPGRLN
jgi:hypothetical protein